MDKYIGKRLQGRYLIEELIGVGGMAYVYKAQDTLEDRPVAVKILKDEFLTNEEFTRRFKNESKAIAIMSHPNIVRVLDVSFEERLYYIVMEHIDGITLKEYIDQQRITWKEAVHFTIQILRALQHAHDKGIVHRDIKPQNIMLLADGTIKVTDFGIAHFSHNTMRTGLGDRAIGSVHYISPEQARGGLIDEKADLYSVGIMMYEMLTGKLPFEADNAVSVAIMQLQSKAKNPSEINPDIPEGLEEITLKAMQKDPEQRYQSAAEMLKDINDFKQNPGIRFEYKYFVDETPTRYMDAITNIRGESKEEEEPKKSLPLIPILIGVVSALVLVAAVVFVWIGGASGLFNWGQGEEDNSVTVPNFIGRSYNEDYVQEKLIPFAEYVTLRYEFDAKEEGTIIDQNYAAGNRIRLNEAHKLELTISKGPRDTKVPAFTEGLTTKTQYESLLKNANLVAKITEIADDSVQPGYVIRTSPKQGTVLKEGQTVTVYVSTGENLNELKDVPNVMYATQAAAISQFESEGFTVKLENIEIVNSKYEAGVVIEQFPEAGTQAARNTEVKLKISSGYRNVTLEVPLIGIDTVVDIQTIVEAKLFKQETGVLASALGVYSVELTEQKSSYTVQIRLAVSGSGQYQTIFVYEVNGETGETRIEDEEPFDPTLGAVAPETPDEDTDATTPPADTPPAGEGNGGGETPEQ